MKTCTLIVTVTVLITIGAFGYVSLGSAQEGKSIEQMVTEAKTPADHEAIATYYDQEAQAAHQKYTEHKKLADFYALTPAIKSKSTTLYFHCGDAAKKYEGIAKDYQAMAKQHRAMAKAAK
jgi:D-aminopeptidase